MPDSLSAPARSTNATQPTPTPLRRPNDRARVRADAVALLQGKPEGMTFTQLVDTLRISYAGRNLKTLANDVTGLDRKLPAKVFKLSKGLYVHVRFRDEPDIEKSHTTAASTQRQVKEPKVQEEKFYSLFAGWLTDELEEVTHAIPLGGNTFRDRWGTPDVIGKYEGRRSDVVKGMTCIVAAEIKVDTANLLTGFGQACAYRLFSHKSYLVIPNHTSADERDRLEALCHMYGIGLVTFDAFNAIKPEFRLLARPVKHEPDLSYTNRYIRHVEGRLFK